MALASLCVAALLTVVYATVGFVIKPSIYSDSSFGFLVWDSFSRGGAFNHQVSPDPVNIVNDVSAFSAWWAPGQYLFPGLLERMGVDLGTAIIIVVTACSALGLWGWHTLYRAFGFSPRTSAIAIALMAATRYYSLPFSIYTGGGILLFSAAPWFLLLVWNCRDLRLTAVIPLAASSLGLMFLKLTGIVLAGAAISAAVLSSGRPWLTRETIRKAMVAALTLGLLSVISYYAWLARGSTPVSVATGFHPSKLPISIGFLVSAIWSGMFSFGDLANYIFLHPSRPILSSGELVYYVLLVPALGTLAIMVQRLQASHADYLRFALLTAASMAAFFVLTWLRNSAVSLEERHLAPISLMLFVGVVEAFGQARSLILRLLFAGAALLAVLYGLGSFYNHARTNLEDPLGPRGVRLHNATAALLEYLPTIDIEGPGAGDTLIYAPSPEVALEVRNSRVIATHADFEDISDLESRIYKGRVRRLQVIVPQRLVANGKADAILKSFVDYPRGAWTRKSLGDFVVYSAVE